MITHWHESIALARVPSNPALHLPGLRPAGERLYRYADGGNVTRLQSVLSAIGSLCFLLCVGSALATSGGCNGQCVATPGTCPPNPTCIDGFRQTGAASCENGGWVCERVACVSDAGECDGACADSGAD